MTVAAVPDRDRLREILITFGIEITDTQKWLGPSDRKAENDPYNNDVVISGKDGSVAQFRFSPEGKFIGLNISEGLWS